MKTVFRFLTVIVSVVTILFVRIPKRLQYVLGGITVAVILLVEVLIPGKNPKIAENCNKIQYESGYSKNASGGDYMRFQEVLVECFINQWLPELTDELYYSIIDDFLSECKDRKRIKRLKELKKTMDKRGLLTEMRYSEEYDSKFHIRPDTCFFAKGIYYVVDAGDTIQVPEYVVDMYNVLLSEGTAHICAFTRNDSVLVIACDQMRN